MDRRPLRVAHIDDDEDLLRMVRLVLQSQEKFTVVSCASGEAALETLPDFRPDLILVDCLMPGMDGPETIQTLGKRMDISGVRVVFATGTDDQDRLVQMHKAGAAAVIRKPFDIAALSAQFELLRGPATIERAPSPNVESIFAKFVERVRTDVQAIMALCREMPSSGTLGRVRALASISSLLHRLAGTSGSFGLSALGTRARALGGVVKTMIDDPDGEHVELLSDFPGQVESLFGFIDDPANLRAEAELATGTVPATHGALVVGVVARGGEFSRKFARVLAGFGYRMRLFADVAQLEQAFATSDLAAVVLKLDGSEQSQLTGLKRVRAMQAQPVPSLVIASSAGFEDYLAAVRAGADGFFVEPVDMPRMEARLHNLIERQRREGLRVMLVDDDTDLLAICAHVLESADMVVCQENNPADALASLEKFRPEVILLDVRMPECTGPELAQIIRLNEQWMHVPIVYMSSRSDGEDQLLATRNAGEAFVAKPIDAKELIATVCANGRHARHMIETSSKDSLTGLLRHSYIKDYLAAELGRAERHGLNTCAVIIDIDKFKLVNDQHGHQVGDVVLRSLSSLLRQRLRAIDGVGRLGGEEFLAVLSNCSVAEAMTIIDGVREAFAQIEFAGSDGVFRSSFSAGIAGLAGNAGSASELLVRADKAMYRAKKLGRDRVVCAPTRGGLPGKLRSR